MRKRCFIFMLILMLCVVIGTDQKIYAEGYKTITDMCGNSVEVPLDPKRIACMHCVSPEKIMTLGSGDRIYLMSEQSPWAYKLFPEIKNARTSKGVKPEEMLDMKIDFVLYTPGMTKGEQYKDAGLRTVCAFSAEQRPMNINDYMESFKKQVTFFGDLLGPDAAARADKYNRYFDTKVKQIRAITSKIGKEERPSVYYGGLHGSLLGSQGQGSVMHWNVEVSGGNYLPEALSDNHAKASMQQLLSWDPDIIILSAYGDSPDTVMKNPELASLKAVRNGKVYRMPMGVYAWDHASNESVLLMIYMAKLFYPDLFKNWDMIKEMKTYYSEIYGKNITDIDAERILQCLPPQ
ncbi:corrinoid ABC transporter substrate-binding protein [Sporomusa ovata DSM 2662]|uniref:Iron(III) ABC transporter, solute-binding protein n=1 Tax=Sporomusa ovata TaxID=2378 RepID=A0A0U1L216_9FIRM|nr:ABC transporter substrate-binding protein [Sporomusa ovata]EQB25162.1 ABC-type Fe3+-hydroxamate transport system, periplasmic component [Sporomusa ovata DSM 2662]CQR73720.1 Iron(III) ABC transporter, solute-binding protein [Sporomusa ovata]